MACNWFFHLFRLRVLDFFLHENIIVSCIVNSNSKLIQSNICFYSGCYVQVNLWERLLFLHQLIHNMTKDCSLIYQFCTWKQRAQNMLCTKIVYLFLFWHSKRFMCTTWAFFLFFVFMYRTGKSMNNLLWYCGLVDARIRASIKDLPVKLLTTWLHQKR